ncbi:MAG: hypothetical protein ABW321_14425 [Polyangiales bacterium]
MQKRLFSRIQFAALSGSVMLAALLVSSGHAHARDRDGDGREDHGGRFMIALDLDYATAVSGDLIEKGGGGGLRVGTEHDLFLVTLIPELTLDYHNFGAEPDTAGIVTGKIGGRIRFLKIVEPGIFAHIGIGNIGGNEQYSHLGPAFDMGATLDLTIIPLIDIGLHVAWNRIFGGYDSGLSYATAGAHVALVL